MRTDDRGDGLLPFAVEADGRRSEGDHYVDLGGHCAPMAHLFRVDQRCASVGALRDDPDAVYRWRPSDQRCLPPLVRLGCSLFRKSRFVENLFPEFSEKVPKKNFKLIT